MEISQENLYVDIGEGLTHLYPASILISVDLPAPKKQNKTGISKVKTTDN